MESTSNYIVFQCYGSESIFHECTFALLSLSRLYPTAFPENTSVWIYTDNRDWFESLKSPLPLHFRDVDKQLIDRWRGDIDFVHRVKIEVLKDFTSNRSGNVLYTDTDIVFTHDIDKLFDAIDSDALFMHVLEGKVSDRNNPIMCKLDNYLKTTSVKSPFDKPLRDMSMWNAGVLGFNTHSKHLLDSVLEFTDTHYRLFPKHIIEQFAFSVFWGDNSRIKSAAPFILHYWNLKEVRQTLASFFQYFKGSSWEDLVKYGQLIQMHVLMQEKVNHPHTLTFSDRIRKKKWQPSKYDWKELVSQIN